MPVITNNQQPTELNLFFLFLSVFLPSLHFSISSSASPPPCSLRFSADIELRVPRILNLGRKQLLAFHLLAGTEGRCERDRHFFLR